MVGVSGWKGRAEARRASYQSTLPPIVDLPGEQWRAFRDQWEVSNMGRFRSIERESEGRDGKVRRFKPRLIASHHGNVRLCYGGAAAKGPGHTYSLARAVHEAFVGPVPDGMRVALRDPENDGPITPDRVALYPYTEEADPVDGQRVVPRCKAKRTDPKAKMARSPARAEADRKALEKARAALASGNFAREGRRWVRR